MLDDAGSESIYEEALGVHRVVTSSSPVTFPVWEILYTVDTLTSLITYLLLTYLLT